MTGPSGAPYATNNATAGPNSTGGFKPPYLQSTVEPDLARPTEDVDSSSPIVPPFEGKNRAEDEDCGPATVTVTLNPTITVTVGKSEAASPSSALSEAIPSSSEPEQPEVSITLSTSATQAAVESSPPTQQPEQVEDSPEVTPDTEPIQAPTQPSSTSVTQAAEESTSPQEQPEQVESPPQTTPETQPTEDSEQPASSSAVQDAPSSETAAPEVAENVAPPASGLKTKRGIIASQQAMDALASGFANSKVSWLCNWFSAPPPELDASITFVPQNYGKQSDIDGEWTKNAEKAVAAGAKYMLSFGEPGTPNDKLNMNPQQAVDLWMEKMEPYAKQGVSIGAPGTLQNTQDFEWLSEFLDACTGCTIGFIAMHWYDKAELKNVAGFKETLEKAAALAKGKPIWLDNFQAAGSLEAQQEFLSEVVPWLEAQDNIQAYAYVPADSENKDGVAGFVENGGLSALGKFYANL